MSWLFLIIHFCIYYSTSITGIFIYKSRLVVFKSTVNYILLSSFPLLIASTNLYTVFILIELISLGVFFFLCLNILIENLNYTFKFLVKWLHLSLVYFWINACVSLLLFITLFTYFFSFNSWNFQIYPLTLIMSLGFPNVGYTLTLLLLVLMIKCGLVPTFFWKIVFFKNNNIRFLAFYILNYYTPLFIYLYLMLDFFLTNLIYTDMYLLCSMYVIVLITATCFLISTSVNLNTFTAVSSVLVSSTLVIVALSTSFSETTPLNPSNVLVYYYYYFLVNTLLFSVILNRLSGTHVLTSTQPVNTSLAYIASQPTFKLILTVIVFSLSTLPPLSTFFSKLILIALLSVTIPTLLVALFMFLFFITLLFYYRNAKFVFTEHLNLIPVNLQFSLRRFQLSSVDAEFVNFNLIALVLLLVPVLALPELLLFYSSLL